MTAARLSRHARFGLLSWKRAERTARPAVHQSVSRRGQGAGRRLPAIGRSPTICGGDVADPFGIGFAGPPDVRAEHVLRVIQVLAANGLDDLDMLVE